MSRPPLPPLPPPSPPPPPPRESARSHLPQRGNAYQPRVQPWENAHQPRVQPWENAYQPRVQPWENAYQPRVQPWEWNGGHGRTVPAGVDNASTRARHGPTMRADVRLPQRGNAYQPRVQPWEMDDACGAWMVGIHAGHGWVMRRTAHAMDQPCAPMSVCPKGATHTSPGGNPRKTHTSEGATLGMEWWAWTHRSGTGG